MPQKNTIKEFVPESFYHIYARGSNKQKIFLEVSDTEYFLGLFVRYLSGSVVFSNAHGQYPNFENSIELLAFCLMGNHFHLLVYQKEGSDLENFMRSLMTGYGRYFNLKYRRTGAVFESRYKAKLIDDQSYLYHISRYIHLNPYDWMTYPYSSLCYYLGKEAPSWLRPEKITELFDSPEEYRLFMLDYEEVKLLLDDLKSHLADR